MTRTYAARKLLEHGPLTLREFVEITGWRYTQARGVIGYLLGLGELNHVNVPGTRRYVYRLAK